MRRRPSPADQAKITTSSATAATRAWRSCVNSGRKREDERFFRISCLFRPWPARGEIVALTGHLAENELRGGLTFIERALGRRESSRVL